MQTSRYQAFRVRASSRTQRCFTCNIVDIRPGGQSQTEEKDDMATKAKKGKKLSNVKPLKNARMLSRVTALKRAK